MFNLQFGEVLAAAGHEEATVIGEIDLSMIHSTRHNKDTKNLNSHFKFGCFCDHAFVV